MSCCGGQRSGTSPLHKGARPIAPTIAFEYTGATSLTLIGGATGRAYRFAHSGAILALDARDAPGASAIAALRRSKAGPAPEPRPALP